MSSWVEVLWVQGPRVFPHIHWCFKQQTQTMMAFTPKKCCRLRSWVTCIILGSWELVWCTQLWLFSVACICDLIESGQQPCFNIKFCIWEYCLHRSIQFQYAHNPPMRLFLLITHAFLKICITKCSTDRSIFEEETQTRANYGVFAPYCNTNRMIKATSLLHAYHHLDTYFFT